MVKLYDIVNFKSVKTVKLTRYCKYNFLYFDIFKSVWYSNFYIDYTQSSIKIIMNKK